MTGICEVCGNWFNLRAGVIRVHGNGRGICSGSGLGERVEVVGW